MADQRQNQANSLDAREKSKHPAEQPWVSDVLSLHSKVAGEKKSGEKAGSDGDG